MSRTRPVHRVRLFRRIISLNTSPGVLRTVAISSIALGILPAYAEEAPVSYPMVATDWHAAPLTAWVGSETPSINFDDHDEGFPNGILTVANHAVAVSNTAHFRNGTIDFDIKPLVYNDTGVVFRRQGNDNGEIFYLRGDPDCPASDDCYQYTPIVHGMLQWNIYPNYQGPAQIAPAGWNHVRVVVAGEKMVVYLNHATEPTLVVPRLQGLTTEGGIALKGPAVYANLVIDPAAPMLDNIQAVRPDPRAIIAWQSARPVAWPAGKPVPTSYLPQPGAWRPIAAEPWGLVDLARSFAETHGDASEIGWLRTTIDVAAPARKVLRLGWANQVSVFLNGKSIFTGDNPYYPVARRISADGRLAPDNASIPLDLIAGHNELVLAVGNGWPDSKGTLVAGAFGWGAEAHLDASPGGRNEDRGPIAR